MHKSLKKNSCGPTTSEKEPTAFWERSRPSTLVRMKMFSMRTADCDGTYPCCTGWGRGRSPASWRFLYPPGGGNLFWWRHIRRGRISTWSTERTPLPAKRDDQIFRLIVIDNFSLTVYIKNYDNFFSLSLVNYTAF